MSEAKDQLCSVQCFGCRGIKSCTEPWRKMTDDTDTDNDSDKNKDNNGRQCLKRRACLSRRCGHPIIIYFQILHTLIMIWGLFFLVALPVLVRISNPSGIQCKRDGQYPYDDTQKCWSQLINVEVHMSAYDITGITFNCLIILFSVLSIIAAYKRKKIIFYAVGCLVILTAIVPMIYTGQMGSLYKEGYDKGNEFDRILRGVYHQLKDSLYLYDNNNPDIMTILDNMMIGGCCCGVNGFRNFLEIGKEIPECCKCGPGTSSNGYDYPTCYGKENNFCPMDTAYNATSRGCTDDIRRQIQPHLAEIHVVKIKLFMYVSTAQLVLAIFAMIFTFFIPHFDRTSGQADDLPAPDKTSSDNSTVKFASLPEPVDTKENVSSGAA